MVIRPAFNYKQTTKTSIMYFPTKNLKNKKKVEHVFASTFN